MTSSHKLIGNLEKGLLFIVSAPAGTGKTTLVNLLTTEFSQIKRSISYTTRSPRKGEIDGIDYHFISKELFEEKILARDFLEYADVFGNYYGTSKKQVMSELEKGHHVILVIDTQGRLNVKDIIKNISIFIEPPNHNELKRRISTRSLDSKESIVRRLEWAKHEIKLATYYDYKIINDDLDIAYQVLKSIIIAEEHKVLNIKNGG
jgi:guanylate kinase